jgi:hypothetical protein
MTNLIESKQFAVVSLPNHPDGFIYIVRKSDKQETIGFIGHEAQIMLDNLDEAYKISKDDFDYLCIIQEYT